MVHTAMVKTADGTTTLMNRPTMPKDDAAAHLYLVVMGAPKEHWVYPIEEKDAQWPYQVKFKGTKIIEN